MKNDVKKELPYVNNPFRLYWSKKRLAGKHIDFLKIDSKDIVVVIPMR